MVIPSFMLAKLMASILQLLPHLMAKALLVHQWLAMKAQYMEMELPSAGIVNQTTQPTTAPRSEQI